MIHIIKNAKWVITTSIACILLGVLTFLTFINKSFIQLNDFNLQVLLFADLALLVIFFGVIIRETYKILKEKKKGTLGSETSLRYILFFSGTTLLPSIIIAIFSLFLFNFGIQNFFNEKITQAVNNSYDVAQNYLEETKLTIKADVFLMSVGINRASNLFYSNKNKFRNWIL